MAAAEVVAEVELHRGRGIVRERRADADEGDAAWSSMTCRVLFSRVEPA